MEALYEDNKLSFALECAKSISWEISLDSGTLKFSDNFETMYGIRQAEYNYSFEGFLDLHLNPHKYQILESIDKYMGGETDCMAVGEITLFDDKRDLNWLYARGKFSNVTQRLIYGVSVDITERKRLEQRLAQKEDEDRQKTVAELKQAIVNNEIVQYLQLLNNASTLTQTSPKTEEYIRLISKLSKREQDVISALLAGNVNYKDLSVALNISPNTVKTHLRRIYQTADVPNIAALISLLQRYGTAAKPSRL